MQPVSLVALFIPLLVLAGVTLGAMALLMPNATVRARLDAVMAAASQSSSQTRGSASFLDRAVVPFLHMLASKLTRVTPETLAQETARNLNAAGNPWHFTPGTFLALKLGLLLALPGSYALLFYRSSSVELTQLMVLGALLLVGFNLPDLWIKRMAEERLTQVNRALPDAIDLLVICIEAGLGFESALGRVAGRTGGALSTEFRRTLAEMSMGKPRREALKALAARCPAADLVSFTAIFSQADKTGVSIGQVLRVQADALRVKRRQRAQEEGHKVPLKMLGPTIFFILPATFAVILGPAGVTLMDNFSVFSGR